MNTHVSDHTNGQSANSSADPSVHTKIQSKVRKNGNGQSMAGNDASGRASMSNKQRTVGTLGFSGDGGTANDPAGTAIAIGKNSRASGNDSIAIGGSTVAGTGATATVYQAIAMGLKSLAAGPGSVAIGYSARAENNVNVALGYNAQALGEGSAVALGSSSLADVASTVSIGNKSTGLTRRLVNMKAGGQTTDAVNVGQLQPVVTALGGGASIDQATGVVTGPTYTLANGGMQTTLSGALSALDKAVSDGAGGVHDKYLAFKTGTSATDLNAQAGNSATALGPNANANAQSAVALGGNTIAGFNAIAIGTLSQATGQSSSAVGLQSEASGLRSTALGGRSTASADSSTAVGHSCSASGVAATGLGQAALATGNYSVAVGIQSSAVGSNTVVIGAGAISGTGSPTTDGDGNIVIGANALVDNIGAGAVVIGRNAQINNNGGDSSVTGAGAIVLGDGATAYGNNSTAIGRGAYTGYPGGVALGDSAKVLSGTASVALGANTLADADMTVSIGNKSTNLRHRLVNMDAGKEAYDAINVSQLRPVVDALGGNASIDPLTGAVTGPTYMLANGGVQTTLSGALSALDKAVSDGAAGTPYLTVNSTGPNALASGSDAIGLGSGASASGNQSVALGRNSIADVDGTVSVGSVVIKRKIVNVASGDVAVTSTDAINGEQLYVTNQQISDLKNILDGSGLIDPGTGTSLAVTYSSAAKDVIQLGNGRPVEIMNVATAIAPGDAVNLSQLTSTVDDLRSELSPSLAYVKVNSTGADATAAGSDAVAIGASAIASLDGSLALGFNARASADQAVALGSDSLADEASSVSIGNKPAGLKRKLVNLQAGVSTNDAVAINQLQPVVTALGGGAAIDPLTGTVTGPTYTLVNGGVQTSLEDALGALDQAVSGSTGNNPYLAINSRGPDAMANGNEAIGLGSGASATGNNAVAIGANAVADVDNTVSVGKPGGERKLVNVAAGDLSAASMDAVNGSQLDATNQTVGQLQDTLTGSGLIDPGTGTSLAVTYSNAAKNIVLLGSLGTPVEIMNVADGLADSDAATVGQVTSKVDGLRNELGNNLKYVRVNATGVAANAGGTNSVAIGSSANTTETGTVAIGIGARASALNCVALGQNSVARSASTVSVGDVGKERKIVNVADGDISDGSTDAINGGQLFNALGVLTTGAGILDVSHPQYAVEGVTGDNTASLNGADPTSFSAMAVGVKSFASGADAAAFGLNTIAQSDHSVAIGSSAQTGADQDYSVAIGSDVYTNGTQAIALGANVQANADNALAIGNNGAFAVGSSSIAIGNKAQDRGTSGIAMGMNAAVANGAISCIAVGTGATVAANLSDAIALGAGASVTAGANGGVALGQGAVANRGTAVSLGGAAATRQIINLSAGTQAADAVNVTQLQGVTTALGGGATVGADGSIVPPSYMVDGTPYANVDDALKAVANLTDANAVSYDDGTTRDMITLEGASGTLLTNVRAGSVALPSTDAINGSQLYGTANSIATNLGGGAAMNPDGTVSPPLYVIDTTTANDVDGALTNLYTVINTKLADAGVLDPNTGRAIAAVTYDGALQNSVTLGGTGATSPVTVSNLASGAVSPSSADAVNGSQLYTVDKELSDLKDALDNGGVIDPITGDSLAVTYADATKVGIVLGTAGTPVTVSNVKAGDASSATSTDAVNGSQLYATNQAISDLADALDNSGIIDPVTGDSLVVTYADANKTNIALGTAGTPVTVSNVKPGALTAASTDTVNGSQLFATNEAISDLTDTLNNSGLIDPSTGQSLAVTYDDASKDGVTLGGTGAAAPIPLHNMATGMADTDGVNVAQLTTGLTDLKSELTNGAIDLKYIKVNSAKAQANANGTDAVSIGPQASATASNGVAIGRGARVPSQDSVAVGVNSVADQNSVLSVGSLGQERKIIYVNDGDISAGSTDAVNGGQLFVLRKALDALAGTRGANGVKDVADPLAAIEGQSGHNVASLNGADPNEATAAAMGVFSVAGGTNAIAVGLRNVASSDYSVALGYMAQTGVEHDYSVAVGSDLQTNAKYAVAFGTRVQANGDYALAMGSNETWAIGESSIALGEAVKVRGKNSIAVGRRAMVASNATDALALGTEASVEAAATGGVALGHGAVADRGNAISIGGGTVGTRQIIHVSAGTELTDAVNVAQLQEAMAAMKAEIQLLRSQLGARSAGQ